MPRRITVAFVVLCIAQICNQYDFGYRSYSKEYVLPDFSDKRSAERYFCLVFGLCYVATSYGQSSKFKKIYEWSQVDFDYDTDLQKQRDITNGEFNPGKIAPIDVDVFYGHVAKPLVFVAIPRFQPGVPVTLGVIQGPTGNIPKIKPYPNWTYQRNSRLCSRDRLVSVFRVQVDTCKRLWVLDTGKILDDQVCPPQVLAFDLNTDKVVHRFELDKSLYTDESIFVTPIVDIRESCHNPFVYLADTQANTIVIYDVLRNKAWKAGDKTMYPYPDQGTYTVQGESFDLMDGVLGMALEPYVPGRDRKLFYHAMSSITENWVYTSHLRNETLFSHGASDHPELFNVYKGRRDSQSAAEGIDNNNVAFFGQMSKTSIYCWNTDMQYGGGNIQLVEYNPKTLQFVTGLKVVNHPAGHQELWLLSDRLQKFATGSVNPQEINVRIMSTTTDEAVKGTTCRRGTNSNRYGHGYGNKRPRETTSDRIVFTS